jgi:hypothetical protein
MAPASVAPICQHCGAPLLLIKVLPRVPEDAPVETRVFTCSGCEQVTTRTARLGADRE